MVSKSENLSKTSGSQTKAAPKTKPAAKSIKAQADTANTAKKTVKTVKAAKSKAAATDTVKTIRKAPTEVEARASDAAEMVSKAVNTRSKHDALKEAALKKQTEKFAELKDSENTDYNGFCSKCGFFKSIAENFAAWVGAYKNIFNFRGRASRYEFWAFTLINLLFFIVLGITFFSSENSVYMLEETPIVVTAIVLLLAMALVYISLCVRRLHDCGYSAWKGHFRPLLIALILMYAFSFSAAYFSTPKEAYSESLYYISTIAYTISLISYAYYVLKITIICAFFEEQKGENAYGEARYFEECYKQRALRFAVWYFLIIIIFSTLVTILTPYLLAFALGYM